MFELRYTPEPTAATEDVVIYLQRHGETEEDVEDRFCGATNSPMTSFGLQSVYDSAASMAAVQFGDIYSDDLDRTLITGKAYLPYSQTGNLISSPLARGLDVGELAGKRKTPENMEEKQYYIDHPKEPFAGAEESLNDGKKRMVSYLAYVISRTSPQMPSVFAVHSSNIKTFKQTFIKGKVKVLPAGLIKMTINPTSVNMDILREGAMSDMTQRNLRCNPSAVRWTLRYHSS